MSRGDKRWRVAGLAAVAAVATTVAIQQRASRRAARNASDAASHFGGFSVGAGRPSGGETLAAPETPEMIAQKVEVALTAWRNAIMKRDADTVLTLDAAFAGEPARYREALIKSAATDTDEHVRAFSTRVLGKRKDPTLAPVFQRLLADKNPYVRQNAAWGLGELAEDARGRAAAAGAIAELRRARSRDPADNVRRAAKGALDKLQ